MSGAVAASSQAESHHVELALLICVLLGDSLSHYAVHGSFV